jgi:hypothetical protein
VRLAGAVLVLAGLIGACGGDTSEDESSSTVAETTTAPEESTVPAEPTTLAEGVTAFRGVVSARDIDPGVAGVDVTVTDAGGEVVGRATSDAEGKWGVEVAAAGTYLVALDTADLPDGLRLRHEEPFELTISAGEVRPVLFSLVAA